MSTRYTPHATPVPAWTPPPAPDRRAGLVGQYCHLDPLQAEAHAALLFRAFHGHDSVWDFLYRGPFSSSAQFHRYIRDIEDLPDQTFYAIKTTDGAHYAGLASYLRIDPDAGSIEIGNLTFAPILQRTRAATEALFLLMGWAFDAGYRRVEWKCNALNLPSRHAAQRLGFSYEGIFRQAAVVKGRNRDTAWYAAIDAEWPALKEAFGVWLRPENFDAAGQQRERLSDLTRLVRVADDPALRC